MNKTQFLTELKDKLYGLPDDDVQSSLDFYSEMIDDRIEDGLSEEEAITQIGEPQEIARQVLTNTPILKLVKENIKPRCRIRTWEIALLILGSPIWFSLLVAAIAVVLSVYVSIWSVIVSIWACEVAFCGSILGAVISAIYRFASGQNVYSAVAMIGVALFLVGFSILFFFVCKKSTKGMVWLTKRIILFIKFCLLRKEEAR